MSVDHLYRKVDVPFSLHHVLVRSADDGELMELSRDGGVALSLDEMRAMKEYFTRLGRDPTDVEFQAIGQAWSEHCCYKSSKPLLKRYIARIDAPQSILAIAEDAGVVEFDDEHAYVVGLESHNHPSAIEPYGGAATGIGGILRDVVCMGAQPIALVDPLFFAPLDTPRDAVPKGSRHPKYLFRGVVAGIRDYGNRVGIPTVAGSVSFHPGYMTNCLVNVGCVGIMRKEHLTRSRVKAPGDILVMAGGRTGRDGIHGVTFASEDLGEDSEEESRGAVQLGDPIMKEPLMHACLECVEKSLLQGMKDFGGGGMSSVVGEIAYNGGYGAVVHLDRVKLKEAGLHPWEIWVSESQERMLLAVSRDNLQAVMDIMDKWDVEATIIGEVVEEPRLSIFYGEHNILDMDLEFYTGGPEYNRPMKIPVRKERKAVWDEKERYTDMLCSMLSHKDVCSRSWVIRQYDHQVRGSTVLTALHGRPGGEGPGDAAVLQPVPGSQRGLALTADVNPHLTELDPYWGSVLAVEEACRNLVSVGARPHSLMDCLNFGNPEKEDRMGILAESVRGLGDMAASLGVPYVSGNVSLYNEGPKGPIPPTPVIMAMGIVEDIHKTVSSDLKSPENPLYLVGHPSEDMGGSLFVRMNGLEDDTVPKTDMGLSGKTMELLLDAMSLGCAASCHDISEGGVAVALAEMCIGGGFGAEVNLETSARPSISLFNEGPTMWIVEVVRGHEKKFQETMGGVGLQKIGQVSDGDLVMNVNGVKRISASVSRLYDAWEAPLWEEMG